MSRIHCQPIRTRHLVKSRRIRSPTNQRRDRLYAVVLAEIDSTQSPSKFARSDPPFQPIGTHRLPLSDRIRRRPIRPRRFAKLIKTRRIGSIVGSRYKRRDGSNFEGSLQPDIEVTTSNRGRQIEDIIEAAESRSSLRPPRSSHQVS